jgi:hypothetical protein
MLKLLVALLLVLQSAPKAPLTFVAPADWTARQPASSMRVAEFTLRRAGGDGEDGDLVLYFFGGSGGSVEANIQRWIGQMQQPDGRPSAQVARRSTRVVNGLDVTLLDISGTYVAEMRPGSTERNNKPGYYMRAAVVTTPGGPYFVKAVGPERTMSHWSSAIDAFIGSMRYQK